MARIALVGNRKMKAFNAPRSTQHTVVNPRSLPLSKIWRPFAGTFIPVRAPVERRYDLLHTFNVIPFTSKPWVITFEDALPRVFFGRGYRVLEKITRRQLLKDNCRRIFAMSAYARNKIRQRNQGWQHLDQVLAKTEVLHPTVPPQKVSPKTFSGRDKIRLLFVGHAFARKGGIVALRLAKIAADAGFPLHIDLVSGMVLNDYADHLKTERYHDDLELLRLANITFHQQLPAPKVLELMREADFQLLATLADTYGYSIIEGLSMATPAIATGTCAIPENVRNGETGYLLNLAVNEWNDWIHIVKSRDVAYRASDEYWHELDRVYSDLARQAFDILCRFREDTSVYEGLSANALHRANTHHNSELTTEKLNSLYDQILSR